MKKRPRGARTPPGATHNAPPREGRKDDEQEETSTARPRRLSRAELRTALGTGPDSLWRDGKPPIFTREELAGKRPLVAAFEREFGRSHPVTQLARATHAICLREARRHERWVRAQLGTLEPPR